MTTSSLHNTTPQGFPPHDLQLKVYCNVRLLKSLLEHPDITIGSRLTVSKLNTHERLGYITCKYEGRDIMITRTTFVNNDFIRYQYSLQLEAKLETISPLNGNLDPLVYPILFPKGEKGWHDLRCPKSSKKCTPDDLMSDELETVFNRFLIIKNL